MHANKPKLVCFDLGNVLVQLASGWQAAAENAGLTLPDGFKSEALDREHGELNRKLETGQLDDDTYFRRSAACLGMRVDHLISVFDAWINGMHAGMDKLLDQVVATGVGTACLSNTNARHWRAMTCSQPYAPIQKLEHRFASHLIGAMKPDPKTFDHVERHTGVQGSEILFFDDDPNNAEAAMARGWHVCRIDIRRDRAEQIRALLVEHGLVPSERTTR